MFSTCTPRQLTYLAEKARWGISAGISSEVCCWIWRGCNVTLAPWKPGYFLTSTALSSAPLNRLTIPFSARERARWVASSCVSPNPLRQHEPCIHMKCQPAWRIMVSKTGAAISCTKFQLPPTVSRSGSKRPGRMHPPRRKTECGFTLARFGILREQRHCRNQMRSQWEWLQVQSRPTAWGSSSTEWVAFRSAFPGSTPEKPVASGWLACKYKGPPLRRRAER